MKIHSFAPPTSFDNTKVAPCPTCERLQTVLYLPKGVVVFEKLFALMQPNKGVFDPLKVGESHFAYRGIDPPAVKAAPFGGGGVAPPAAIGGNGA